MYVYLLFLNKLKLYVVQGDRTLVEFLSDFFAERSHVLFQFRPLFIQQMVFVFGICIPFQHNVFFGCKIRRNLF